MKLAEAQHLMLFPKFGDARCVEARDTVNGIARANEIRERLKPKFCHACDGEGTHCCPDCDHEHDCQECGGIGLKHPALTTDCELLEEMWGLLNKYGH